MAAIRPRRPSSVPAGIHLALGLLLGGLVGATAGLVVGVRRYIDETDMVISEPNGYPAADQPGLFVGGKSDPVADDCTGDPRVAWPLLGLVAGAILGMATAQGYDEMLRLGRERQSTPTGSPTSKGTG